MKYRKSQKEKWRVLSPDGLPIREHPFTSRSKADAAAQEWIARFRIQGYYAKADGENIHVDHLLSHLTFEQI